MPEGVFDEEYFQSIRLSQDFPEMNIPRMLARIENLEKKVKELEEHAKRLESDSNNI